jgi:hypothetical protein
MERIAVIGNAGGGKSVLARRLGAKLNLPCIEIDALLWRSGWRLSSDYDTDHAQHIARDYWIIDGLGSRASIPARLSRATDIILVDMELWVHFWLAARRQLAWELGQRDYPPGGFGEIPPLDRLFRTIWEVDSEWMPEMRRLVDTEAQNGKKVYRIGSVEGLDGFVDALAP